jgi:hypothetical protein
MRVLLAPACTSSTLSFSNCNGSAQDQLLKLPGNDNLNDTAFNQDTANTAGGINGAGPTPGIGLNSFYGPWLERIDVGLGRASKSSEGKELEFQARPSTCSIIPTTTSRTETGSTSFNTTPSAATCGDGMTLNQTCYLVPNSGPGNFGALQEISPNGLPRILQFSVRFAF